MQRFFSPSFSPFWVSFTEQFKKFVEVIILFFWVTFLVSRKPAQNDDFLVFLLAVLAGTFRALVHLELSVCSTRLVHFRELVLLALML